MNATLRMFLLATLVAFTLTGCTWKQVLATVGIGAAAGGAAAGYYYVEGDLEADLDADLEDSYDASIKALEALDWDIEEKDLDDDKAKIVAEKGDDKVTIKLTEDDDDETEISIRVGTFGDEELSEEILDKIEDKL